MIRAGLILCLFAAGPALAQEALTDAARTAAAQVMAAQAQLAAAAGSDDEIAALTAAIAAQEQGLAAFREGLRRAAIRRQTIEADLAARNTEIAALLAALLTMGDTPEPLLLLHPSGPLGTARAGMILAEVAPALQAEAESLRATLNELAEITALQTEAAAVLQTGLDTAAEARAALARAMQNRTDPPRRFVENPEATALLVSSAETLAAFANGLGQIVEADLGATAPDARAQKGALPWPVPATLLRRAGEADAAGIARPGWVLATAPGALVTAPAAATVRFQGPLLDYGLVIILEPAPNFLVVLAGLGQVLVATGEVVAAGAPLGLMGGNLPDVQAILTETATGTGAVRSETLYLEVRDAEIPIDPAEWFGPG